MIGQHGAVIRFAAAHGYHGSKGDRRGGHADHAKARGRKSGQAGGGMSQTLPRVPRAGGWLVWVLAWLLGIAPAWAGDPWAPFDLPWFDRVGVTDGLPHAITTSVVQDSRGLIWIGTMGGLVRYDGFRTQVYTQRNDDRGLPDAYVRCLLALPDGALLIGTGAGGLVRFQPGDETFHRYPTGAGGVADRKIYALTSDGAGGVLIASERGLDRLDLARDRIEHIDTGKAAAPRDFSALRDRAGNLWLGNDRGLFVRWAGQSGFVRVEAQGAIAQVLADQVWALREDREGRLWVGTLELGVVYRDRDGSWHALPGFSGSQSDGARRATVRDILETSSGALWFATDGNGVITYVPGEATMRELVHDAAMPSSLPGDAVRGLFEDRSGNVWAATDLGVAHANLLARRVFTLQPSMQAEHALANVSVRGIFVDSHGRIWLGLGAGHIDVIDLATASIRHLELGGRQRRRDVQAFAEAADGSIWVGTQGLARVDPQTFAVQGAILPQLDRVPVLHLLADGDALLIGTYDGLYRYEPASGALAHIEHVANDPGSLASSTVRQIARVNGAYWYLTSRGISIATAADQRSGFVNLLPDPADPDALPGNQLDSLAVDARGRIWVGTAAGLAWLNSARPPYRFHTLHMADGLGSDSINAVLPDAHGNVWASLPNGIARVDGATLHAQTLGVRDGLRVPSYIYAAAARAPSGELLFGGLGGLTVIRPDWQSPPRTEPVLAITRVTVNERGQPIGNLPPPGGSLTLAPEERNLRVAFALLDYQAQGETVYSYRLDGFDQDWITMPLGLRPYASYTNLPHGSYPLRLRAVTRGLEGRTYETVLHVSVQPRWYETPAAALLGLLLLLAGIVVLVQLRTVYLRRQARQLQERIDRHTLELRAANQRLDELASTDELTGVYNRRRFLALLEEVRQRTPAGHACLLLLDLDHFKRINDSRGHIAGDAVIRQVAQTLVSTCRKGDLVGRYGGEELVVCLPDCELAQGIALAERIRQALAELRVLHGGVSITVTASIGVAAHREGESLTQWLARADEALYEAKRDGRNRCAVAA